MVGSRDGLGGHGKILSAPGASASAGAILTAECPVLAYPQGAADLCAAYGFASAVHTFGETCGGAAIAACARAALKVRCRARILCGYERLPAGVLASLPLHASPRRVSRT